MVIPEDLHYTKEHEWVRVEGSKATVGITDYAQDALGDVVFVDLPSVGNAVIADASMAEVESTKSVSTIYAPLAGTVTSVNDLLSTEPQHINSDPYGNGWLCTLDLDDPASVTDLLSATDYRQLIDGPNQ
jgi:glycine cleavage system H protein